MDLIPTFPLIRASRVFEYGAGKYEQNSWRWAPSEHWRVKNSVFRHLLAEEEIDPESGLPHLDHALASLMILIQNEEDGRNNTKETSDSDDPPEGGSDAGLDLPELRGYAYQHDQEETEGDNQRGKGRHS